MYRKRAFSEDDDIHIERLKVGRAIWVLVETTETDKVVVPEQFNFLASFLHENIFCGKRMDGEHLIPIYAQSVISLDLIAKGTNLAEHFHFIVRRTHNIQPPGVYLASTIQPLLVRHSQPS